MPLVRILSHFTSDRDGVCEINNLYDYYKFGYIEAGYTDAAFTLKLFIDHLTALFPDVTKGRRYVDSQCQTIYRGVSLKEVVIKPEPLSFSEIHNYIPNNMELISVTDTDIKIHQDSGCLCNANCVYKVMNISSEGTFDVTISGKPIDLPSLNIDPFFKFDLDSIVTLFAICDSLRLCNGMKIKTSSQVFVSRYHTLGYWTYNNQTFRSLRSLTCPRVVSANSISLICRKCQKMVFQEKEKQADKSEPETTEETIRRIFPGAPTKMVTFLSEQAKNVSRDVKGRRWSKEIIASCTELYKRSPTGYELLKNTDMFILPSSTLLALSKSNHD